MIKTKMQDTIKQFAKEFKTERSQANTTKDLKKAAPLLTKKLRDQVYDFIKNSNITYSCKGSVGATNIAAVPWLAIFDNEITNTAQEGYYVVILFKSDISGFYISLNQAWTQYSKAFNPPKLAREQILKNALICSKIISAPGFKTGPIQLMATTPLSKGYEIGNIFGKEFDFKSNFTDKDIENAISDLLFLYRQLKNKISTNILRITGVDEDIYQESIQNNSSGQNILPNGPIAPPGKSNSSSSSTVIRSSAVANIALTDANHQCFFNSAHHSFISKVSNKPFMEAHHLIPIGFQDKFKFSLDVPENILVLCPNCHRKVHHGVPSEVKPMLSNALNARSLVLKNRKITITETELANMYFKK